MRIPLDYYRILGLPLAASDEQLQQAYSDRVIQLPRREYSTAAITSRKKLIEEAYVVLSNPKERKEYDRLYLANAYGGSDSAQQGGLAVESRIQGNGNFDLQNLSIDVSQDELVGALLILQELGEYELILKLGRPYIVSKNGVAVKQVNRFSNDEYNSAAVERPDIILTVALACLELGREQWQQGHYENAAISLETGDELLSREGLFPNLRAEIQADLHRLRPYRILELLALPEENTTEREQGLILLQEILNERGGIDGNGDDQSGLSIDDFLRFIQQLRNYLTVAEQHLLFEEESKRPSAVATYLAVYALIARGFTQRQPALIREAKQMLTRLGKRQDVHLEQSLCALLLGQTEVATRVLELSQEYEALAFIREKSQDSPDLLPGLCLYGERWLQNDVFPHFRDVASNKASLKEYFADQQVQAYLELLPAEAETTNEQSGNSQVGVYTQTPSRRNGTTTRQLSVSEVPTRRQVYSNLSPANTTSPTPTTRVNSRAETPVTSTTEWNGRVSNHNLNGIATTPHQPQRQRRQRSQPNGVVRVPDRTVAPRRRRVPRSPEARKRLILRILASTAGVLILWLLVITTFGWLTNLFSSSPSHNEQLFVQLNEPPIPIPEPNSKPELTGPLTAATAEEVIQTWLATKAAAMGQNHKIDSLNQILVGSALAQWQQRVKQDIAVNRYRKYDHSLIKVESIDKKDTDPDRATVEATVKEVAEFHENGQVNKQKPYTVRVRYDLVHHDDGWRIQGMSVLNETSP